MNRVLQGVVKTALGIGIIGAVAMGATAGAAASTGSGTYGTPLALGQFASATRLSGYSSVTVDTGYSLPSGAGVSLYGVNASGQVVGSGQACTLSGSEVFTCSLPSSRAGVASFVAIDPIVAGSTASDSNDQMAVNLSPSGGQAANTTITATVTGVPISNGVGSNVFLVGVQSKNADDSSAPITVLVPCTTQTVGGKATATCTFRAPAGYATQYFAFEAHTVTDVESLPVNNLPEVPFAAALPLMMIPAGLLLRRRLRMGA